MSHKAIRLLIESTAKSLQDDIQYSYGSDSDFSLDKERSFTFIQTNPLVSIPGYRSNNSTTNYMKQWGVSMMFCKVDEMNSSREDYSAILDYTDTLVDNFINQLNFFSPLSGTIVLSGFSQVSFIKGINILTGWTLDFQMLVSDNFEYCKDC